MKNLFRVDPKFPDKICQQCIHKVKKTYGSSAFHYCKKLKSNPTDNGLLKIKARNPACHHFEEIEK